MKNKSAYKIVTLLMALALLAVSSVAETGVTAQNSNPASYEIEDKNPAIYVAARNANSVVGVIVNAESWSDRTREVTVEPVSEGSGVVIDDAGYIITNYHVVSKGDVFEILMPNGETVDAELVGYDSSVDLAVMKVDEEHMSVLTPAAIGSVSKLSVGSSVFAIGNPGGSTLSNTVTGGMISCLERNVDASNTSRTINYIQHDAPISSGNSGGGLFDVNGNLVGINTLKYGNSMYSNSSYEGLGFAIPIDYAYDIAVEIIEEGRVRRVGLGVTIQEADGAEEPTDEQTPTGLYVVAVTKDGPADTAGIKEGDFIIALNDERIYTMEDLTDIIDKCEEGDKVTVTIARYTEVGASEDGDGGFTRTSLQTTDSWSDYFGSPFGSFGSPFGFPFDMDDFYDYYYNQQQAQPVYELEIIDVECVLEYLN
ncbi:MAG: trypsin-like peptidase domain-containing protein [Clostridia bacterium]|nr:trypsin-like peptidase domain-containing protein [Clostridia bacterium]